MKFIFNRVTNKKSKHKIGWNHRLYTSKAKQDMLLPAFPEYKVTNEAKPDFTSVAGRI